MIQNGGNQIYLKSKYIQKEFTKLSTGLKLMIT